MHILPLRSACYPHLFSLLLVLLGLIFLLPHAGLSQDGRPRDRRERRERRERIEAFRVAYYTEEIGLTPREAQTFWPVFQAYEGEMQAIREELGMKDLLWMDSDSLSEAEVQKLVNMRLQYKRAELAVMEQYHTRFLEVLSPRKVARLYLAEVRFKQKLLEIIRQRRQERGAGR